MLKTALFKLYVILGLTIIVNPSISVAYDFWPGNFWSDYQWSESWNFLSWDLWLDLYKKMEEWFTKLQFKLYENELKWWEADWTIIKTLNNQMKLDYWYECFKDNAVISAEDLNNLNNDITVLIKEQYLKEECYIGSWKSFWISIDTISEIVSSINEYNKKAKIKANEKAKDLYKVARIWLYTDWDTDNSPFDLRDDLKKIDEILFTQEIPYNWVNSSDSDNWLSNLLSWEEDNNTNTNSWWSSSNWNNWTNSSSSDTPLSELLGIWISNDNWNIVCQANNSWLEDSSLEDSWIATWDNSACSNEWKKWVNICCEWLKKTIVNWQSYCIDNSKWSSIKCLYKWSEQEWYYYINWDTVWTAVEKTNCSKFDPINEVDYNWNDFWWSWIQWWNWDWPCNDIFCITIEFITKNYWLSWWKTKSIESIINRSNKHLKKNTSTSMTQAKMTINNNEIMLRDLDLAEKFNIWVNLSWKSPPILNLEKKEEDNPTKIKKWIEDMLDIAYEENWMDYMRANDLQIFWEVQNTQYCAINKAELTIDEINNPWKSCTPTEKNKNDLTSKLANKRAIQQAVTDQIIDSKVQWLTMDKFTKEFIEISKIIDYLADWYAPNAQWYIKMMFDDIPVWGG